MCYELGWVDGDGFVWRCGDWVKFVSNVTTRFSLSSRAMVLLLDLSIISFSSFRLTSPRSGNNFSQYRIWSSKDDSRAISCVLS